MTRPRRTLCADGVALSNEKQSFLSFPFFSKLGGYGEEEKEEKGGR